MSDDSLSELELETAIVVDNGSETIKAGLAGYERPSVIFKNIVGTARAWTRIAFGDDVSGFKALLTTKSPVERGIVQDWDAMEKVWRHVFEDELSVDTQEHPVLISEAPLNPKNNREITASVFFEKFATPALYLAAQAVLALHSSAKLTGTVVDIGEEVTHIVPVYRGCSMPHAVSSLSFGGRDLTEHLSTLLGEAGRATFTSEAIRGIKETLCYVAEDYETEMKKPEGQVEGTYTLPDGKPVKIAMERFKVPEALFRPSLRGVHAEGIHGGLIEVVKKCDRALSDDLLENILLAGGSTLFPGLEERLRKEVIALAANNGLPGEVLAPPDRSYSVWVGGSIAASLSSFEPMWISKREYEEWGPSIVHTKCF